MQHKKKVIIALIAMMILAMSAHVHAVRDVGEIADGLTDQANIVGILIVAISAVLGVVFFIMGGFQLKGASSRRADASVGKGLTYIAVGVLFVSVLTFAAAGSKTIFGDESSISDHIEGFE